MTTEKLGMGLCTILYVDIDMSLAYFLDKLSMVVVINAISVLSTRCMCMTACYHSSASIRRMCDKLNLPARSSLITKGFQLADFTKELSFRSYSLLFTVSFSIIEVATCQYNYSESTEVPNAQR